MTSHLQWAQQVPRGWSVKPLRAVSDYVVSNVDKVPVDGEHVVRLCNYSDVYNNEFITQELEFMVSTATEDEIRKFGLLENDVIITKDSESWDDIGVPALVVETAADLVCGYHLALLRPRASSLSGRFLHRCLQAKVLRLQLELASNGVTRFGLPKSDIGSMQLPVPPIVTQAAIAEHLDRETARLDNLVAAKQRVLDLLGEKRKAVIATAVTRGLDPKVRLRDSGVPWLGEIPAHWRSAQLRRYMQFITSGSRGWAEHYSSAGALFLRIGNLTRDSVQLDLSDAQRVDPPQGVEGERTRVQVGDLLFSITAYLGSIALIDSDFGQAYVSQHVALVRLDPSRDLFPRYAAYAALSHVGQAQLSAQSYGGTKMQLALDDIRELWLPLPPLDEQRAIADHIACEMVKFDAVRAATERTIALLKERRSALIAAAVTGQLDVGSTA